MMEDGTKPVALTISSEDRNVANLGVSVTPATSGKHTSSALVNTLPTKLATSRIVEL